MGLFKSYNVPLGNNVFSLGSGDTSINSWVALLRKMFWQLKHPYLVTLVIVHNNIPLIQLRIIVPVGQPICTVIRSQRTEGGYRVYIERLFLIKFSNFFSKVPLFLYYHWSKPAVFDNSLSSPDPKNQILYEMVKTKEGFWHF